MAVLEKPLRWVIGALFVVTGALKVTHTQDFTSAVMNYQLTSWTVAILTAVYLPWLEIVAGLALCSRRLYPGALIILFGLCLIFTGAIASAWVRDLDINCGCFGSESNSTNYPLHLAGDVLLAAALALLAWREALTKQLTPTKAKE